MSSEAKNQQKQPHPPSSDSNGSANNKEFEELCDRRLNGQTMYIHHFCVNLFLCLWYTKFIDRSSFCVHVHVIKSRIFTDSTIYQHQLSPFWFQGNLSTRYGTSQPALGVSKKILHFACKFFWNQEVWVQMDSSCETIHPRLGRHAVAMLWCTSLKITFHSEQAGMVLIPHTTGQTS